VVLYQSDIEPVRDLVQTYYRPIEAKSVVPDSQWEFGYFGEHYILLLPTDFTDKGDSGSPDCFELQIKTVFQHAWSEANHDLGYKVTGAPLTPDETRRLAFTAAQAWGADQIFDELARSRIPLRKATSREV
jgi:ppGpp synthetase/RelA/SpoT-type nucleotidyltranferase